MTRLYFYNNWHNGDLIFERPLVRRILDRYPDVQITWGCWRNHQLLVQDLPVIVLPHAKDDREPTDELRVMCPSDHHPIYLWVGQYPDTKHTCWRNVVEVYNRQVRALGLDLCIAAGDVPMIDFPYVDVTLKGPAVYVENGLVRAMQSAFHFDLQALAREFPELNFYCTADPGVQAPNVFNCGRLNLVQLSAVSNKCDALIGKGSGTFACAMTEANRFKPQALMGFHSHDGPTFWEYPGCPTQYLETNDELRAFLHAVRQRPRIDLTRSNATPTSTPPVGAVLLPPGTPLSMGAAGGYVGALSEQILINAALFARHSEVAGIVRSLMQCRERLARVFAATPDSALEPMLRGAAGRAYDALQQIHLKLERYEGVGEESLRASERAFVDDMKARAEHGWNAAGACQSFLAASLYFYAHELNRAFDVPGAPAGFVARYVEYLLTPATLFTEAGGAQAYLDYAEKLARYFAESERALPDGPLSAPWAEALVTVVQRLNFIPLYFNERNVREVFSHRGDVIERVLRRLGHATDHAFATPRTSGPLRIGILAQNFLPSAETSASLPLYEHLDPAVFEVALYCLHSADHPTERYCRSRAKRLSVLPGELPAQVSALRQDELDVLFFASNVAAVTNPLALLAAHRLARAQVTSIFSVVSTGFRHMDVYVSGSTTDPMASAAEHYRERLVKMDGSVHCFASLPDGPATQQFTREAAGIPADAIVFASAANLYKLIPELVNVYAKIVASVPKSILLLCPYGPNWSSVYPKRPFVNMVVRALQNEGVGPDRLRILDVNPPPGRADLKEVLKLADVYLDSFPFCGSTSLMEPLEIGLPLVVKRGGVLRSSMAAAMLEELGLPDLIAPGEAEYVKLATALGNDAEFRSRVSENVRTALARGPRFTDTQLYAARIGPIFQDFAANSPTPR